MNYRKIIIQSSIIVSALCMATASMALPQEKFKVIVQKGDDKDSGELPTLHYAFCKIDPVDPQKCVITPSVKIHTLEHARKNKTTSGGFSKLLAKDAAKSPQALDTVRLLVCREKSPLIAKLNNNATPDQTAKIAESVVVNRYHCTYTAGTTGTLSLQALEKLSSIEGSLTFTIKHSDGKPAGMEVLIQPGHDKRSCKQQSVSRTRSDSTDSRSTYEKAKGAATSAWESTKKAASSATKKMSSAATRAKESISERYHSWRDKK